VAEGQRKRKIEGREVVVQLIGSWQKESKTYQIIK